jgi:hypothetical protein
MFELTIHRGKEACLDNAGIRELIEPVALNNAWVYDAEGNPMVR